MGTSGSGGERKSEAGSWATVLALVTQLGFSIACPMVVFIGGGAWLGNQLGWGPWLMIVGILLGVATAAGLFYQIATLPTRQSQSKADDRSQVPYKMEGSGSKKGIEGPRADKSDQNGY
jgi:protein-S-isoprenylcysteine O-methyltransferase Ste14